MREIKEFRTIEGQFLVKEVARSFSVKNPLTGEKANYKDLLLVHTDWLGKQKLKARCLSIVCHDVHPGDVVNVLLSFKYGPVGKRKCTNRIFIDRLKKVTRESKKQMFNDLLLF